MTEKVYAAALKEVVPTILSPSLDSAETSRPKETANAQNIGFSGTPGPKSGERTATSDFAPKKVMALKC